jgi:hypothetical protein
MYDLYRRFLIDLQHDSRRFFGPKATTANSCEESSSTILEFSIHEIFQASMAPPAAMVDKLHL